MLYLLAKAVLNQILCNSFICCWLNANFCHGLEVPDYTSFDASLTQPWHSLSSSASTLKLDVLLEGKVECVIAGGSHLV